MTDRDVGEDQEFMVRIGPDSYDLNDTIKVFQKSFFRDGEKRLLMELRPHEAVSLIKLLLDAMLEF